MKEKLILELTIKDGKSWLESKTVPEVLYYMKEDYGRYNIREATRYLEAVTEDIIFISRYSAKGCTYSTLNIPAILDSLSILAKDKDITVEITINEKLHVLSGGEIEIKLSNDNNTLSFDKEQKTIQETMDRLGIKVLDFGNKKTTIVKTDGCKGHSTCSDDDKFDPEVAFALSYAISMFDSKAEYKKFIENVYKEKKIVVK